MTYIVLIYQYGKVVKQEQVGSQDAARAIAQQWRNQGFTVRVTNENNASISL